MSEKKQPQAKSNIVALDCIKVANALKVGNRVENFFDSKHFEIHKNGLEIRISNRPPEGSTEKKHVVFTSIMNTIYWHTIDE